MALERIVSNKHFSGNYTDQEILNLFSQDENIKYGEVIIFNDKTNPSIYFLDENGELASIQKVSVDDGSDLDDLMDSIRYVAEDLEKLETTVIENKEELLDKIAGLSLRLEILEENGSNIPPDVMEKIDKNASDIVLLQQTDTDHENRMISIENKIFILEDEIDENEVVHSAGLNVLNDSIKKLDKRISTIEEGGLDIDFGEVEERITNVEESVNILSGKTDDIEVRLKSVEEGNVDIDLTPIENKLVELETNLTETNDEVTNLSDNINLIDNRLTKIEESGIESINTKINDLENKDDEIISSISDLKNNNINPLERKVSTLETTAISHSQRIAELEKIDLEPIEKDIISLKDEDIKINETLVDLTNETSNLRGILSDLSEEVEENELVHSAGLSTLNHEIKGIETRVKYIEDNGGGNGNAGAEIVEINEKIDTISGHTVSLNERVNAIEEGQVEVDLTEVNDKIDTISGQTIILTTQYAQLLEIDANFEERIDVLEEKPEVDLTPIENKLIELEAFDDNINKELNNVKNATNNALTKANESIKTIEITDNELINVDVNIKDRKATLSPSIKTVNISEANDLNDGLAKVMDIKSEIERVVNEINAYNVNGKIISKNPVLSGEDLNVGENYLINKPSDSQNIINTDTLGLAISKLEKKLDIAIEIFTATLNDLNNRINELEDLNNN